MGSTARLLQRLSRCGGAGAAAAAGAGVVTTSSAALACHHQAPLTAAATAAGRCLSSARGGALLRGDAPAGRSQQAQPSTLCSQYAGLLLPRQLTHASASTSAPGSPLAAGACARPFFSLAGADTCPASKKFNQRKVVGWTPEQMYNVISQVEHYHLFVPWCQKSHVLKRVGSTYLEAELVVGFQMLVERYTSQVHLSPGQVRSTVSDSYLFHHLDSTWRVEPGPTPKSCWLTFNVGFAFRSQLHSYLADVFFSEVVKQMTGAFEGRCATVYGPSSLLRVSRSGAA